MTPIDESIRAAARARAEGLGWPHAADRAKRATATVRRWPKTRPAQWARALAEAQAEVAAEATAEAVGLLRKQLRSDDDKIKLAAARALLAATLAKARGPAADDDLSRAEDFLRTLSPDDARSLEHHLGSNAPAAD